MYALTLMEGVYSAGRTREPPVPDCPPAVTEGRPVERPLFIADTGLSAVRELALALGLVEIDDPALWELL